MATYQKLSIEEITNIRRLAVTTDWSARVIADRIGRPETTVEYHVKKARDKKASDERTAIMNSRNLPPTAVPRPADVKYVPVEPPLQRVARPETDVISMLGDQQKAEIVAPIDLPPVVIEPIAEQGPAPMDVTSPGPTPNAVPIEVKFSVEERTLDAWWMTLSPKVKADMLAARLGFLLDGGEASIGG